MECLSKQDFAGAQKLFFDNARTAPSHETYNNLGYFLCTEGLECRSGKTRYAGKLGFSYLLKAEKLKCTSVNQSNIAGELEKRRAEKFLTGMGFRLLKIGADTAFRYLKLIFLQRS